MGAGGSIPERLDLETCKNVAGLKFDQETFDSLCDDQGFVTKSQLFRVAEKSRALEAVSRDGRALRSLSRDMRGLLLCMLLNALRPIESSFWMLWFKIGEHSALLRPV